VLGRLLGAGIGERDARAILGGVSLHLILHAWTLPAHNKETQGSLCKTKIYFLFDAPWSGYAAGRFFVGWAGASAHRSRCSLPAKNRVDPAPPKYLVQLVMRGAAAVLLASLARLRLRPLRMGMRRTCTTAKLLSRAGKRVARQPTHLLLCAMAVGCGRQALALDCPPARRCQCGTQTDSGQGSFADLPGGLAAIPRRPPASLPQDQHTRADMRS
jgi:hypothetical protein